MTNPRQELCDHGAVTDAVSRADLRKILAAKGKDKLAPGMVITPLTMAIMLREMKQEMEDDV